MSTTPCAVLWTPSTYASAPTAWALSVMARTSGRVPSTLLAPVTATTRVRSSTSSPYCSTGSSPGLDVDLRPPHLDAGRLGPLHPRPHVGVVVELARPRRCRPAASSRDSACANR